MSGKKKKSFFVKNRKSHLYSTQLDVSKHSTGCLKTLNWVYSEGKQEHVLCGVRMAFKRRGYIC